MYGRPGTRLGIKDSLKTRKLKTEANKRRWNNKSYRERMKISFNKIETREKHSYAMKQYWKHKKLNSKNFILNIRNT